MLNASNEYEVPVHDVRTSLFWSDVQLQCLPQHSAPPGSGMAPLRVGDGMVRVNILTFPTHCHNTTHCTALNWLVNTNNLPYTIQYTSS